MLVEPCPSTRMIREKPELSYNNIADADAAWECVKSFVDVGDAAACVIVKHANPCGAAVAATPLDAYRRAFATDPTSAFGGIIAFNRPLDAATVELVSAQFLEVLIAPGYTTDALEAIRRKVNVRVLEIELPRIAEPSLVPAWDMKRVGGGLLLQTPDVDHLVAAELRVVTKMAPTIEQLADLVFAWRVARFVKSNAIVHCADGRTLGIGAGQMSRVDSSFIAAHKAGENAKGSVIASDAFFPFRDGVDEAAKAGATAIIQPGGSIRDQEVIDAANEHDMAMVFTGVRVFRH
jgi:phosphoribosylaminoimidazolecarboxamide formyltransferase/IMP cyclohydrolase